LPRGTLNLGILAHVDAGKTTLTERLLYAAGVIDAVGSVDAGTTRTDTLALERQRGITIRSAVVTFELAGVRVNLIDTPGHPDFIAEVERVLSLLDGAVLVVSAVEGVQPQTRILWRALRRPGIPTVLFVNKIDRVGADPARVLAGIARRLSPGALPLGTVADAGTRAARFTAYQRGTAAFRTALLEPLAEGDDALLAAYVAGEHTVPDTQLWDSLVRQARAGRVYPVYFGSAITGEGVPALGAALVDLLPAPVADADAPLSARVFKIDRGPAGEKVAHLRVFAGTVRAREPVPVRTGDGRDGQAKATALRVSEGAGWVPRDSLAAGDIGRAWGLAGVRIGDTLGQGAGVADGYRFPPPTMETVVTPVRAGDAGALRAALARLAEEDPLITVRVDGAGGEVSVPLYGEVQKEVIEATLADGYGIAVTCHESTVICVERPVGTGEAAEYLNADGNPFHATVGLRVEPGPPGSGVEFRLAVGPQTIPLYVYRNAAVFTAHMDGYVRRARTRAGTGGR
jgi:ribosomal protection tetracycline resistance protein